MYKFLIAISLLFLNVNGFAQTRTTTSTKLDANTIVKDVSGTILPYAIWSKLLQTGEYTLRKKEGTAEFVACQMSDEEKAKAAERKNSQMTTMPKPRPSSSFVEGEKFKGEKMTDMMGNKFDLKTISDKIYVINFWFINCPPCKQEIPDLNKIVEKYKENKDVVFLAIALDNRNDLKKFLSTSPFNYNIVDKGEDMLKNMG